MYPLYLTQNSIRTVGPLELIDIAAQNGFDGISVRLIPISTMPFFPIVGDKELIAEIKAALTKSRIRLIEIYTLYIRPEFDFAQYVAALQLGAELGASFAMILCFDPEQARREDNLGRLCDAAAPLGLTLGVEFVPTSNIRTAQEAASFIAATGRKNASIVIDPMHLYRSGGKPADIAAVDPRLWRYTQINDFDIAAGEARLLGEGNLPLRELLGVLPPGIPLIPEISAPKDRPVPPREWAERIATSTRAFLQQ